MNIKAGDIITFKSTGYKPDGELSNKKFLQYAANLFCSNKKDTTPIKA